ncbi:MAG: mobile mystery protein A [Candidatus Omnitrophica bacterium]|nr:mobile mystery protein A [Candidatus Omnitrophota bacterium]
MVYSKKALVIEQLDSTLSNYSAVKNITPPTKGWIKSIRKALGMTSTQLAKRLNVSSPRVSILEQSESSGALTLKTLRKVAQELDCLFVYALVPRESLRKSIEKQAYLLAKKIIKQSSQSMFLEKQALSQKEIDSMLQEKAKELSTTLPSYLWEKI